MIDRDVDSLTLFIEETGLTAHFPLSGSKPSSFSGPVTPTSAAVSPPVQLSANGWYLSTLPCSSVASRTSSRETPPHDIRASSLSIFACFSCEVMLAAQDDLLLIGEITSSFVLGVFRVEVPERIEYGRPPFAEVESVALTRFFSFPGSPAKTKPLPYENETDAPSGIWNRLSIRANNQSMQTRISMVKMKT